MAKNGSGRVLSFTRAATTVVGTVTSCHPLGTKAGVEMISPLASTLAEDCSVQWSRRASWSGVRRGPVWRRECRRPREGAEKRKSKQQQLCQQASGEGWRLSGIHVAPFACGWSTRCRSHPRTLVRELRGITRLLIRFNSGVGRGLGSEVRCRKTVGGRP